MSKGNPNPNRATRFGAGQPQGRKPGSRDLISRAFLEALADDFQAHGKGVVATVRKTDPSTYLRVFAGLLPKEIEITRPLDGMDDSAILAAIEALTEIMRTNAPPPPEDEEKPKVLQ